MDLFGVILASAAGIPFTVTLVKAQLNRSGLSYTERAEAFYEGTQC